MWKLARLLKNHKTLFFAFPKILVNQSNHLKNNKIREPRKKLFKIKLAEKGNKHYLIKK